MTFVPWFLIFSQGIYRLMVTLDTDGEFPFTGIVNPTPTFSSPSTLGTRARGNKVAGSDVLSVPAFVDSDQNAFHSRAFLIRYTDEHVASYVSYCFILSY